jgi:hypothetical protein
MQEQRDLHRSKTYLGAEIGFTRQLSPASCIIRNLSSGGAMLQLDNVSAIPSRFEIRIPTKGHSHRAKIVWQQLGRAGVAFENGCPDSVDTVRRKSLPARERLQERIEAILKR